MTNQTHEWLIEEAAGHGITRSAYIRRLLVGLLPGPTVVNLAEKKLRSH